jgi:vacuolar-type H+-ATPase subunit E/Vma4
VTTEGHKPQDVLRDEILADARRQCERAARRAKREADAIVAKAEDAAKQARQEQIEAAEGEAARRRERVLATVPVEMRRLEAARVEEALVHIYDAARERLRKREGFDYRGTVAALAAEAIEQMEGTRFVVALCPEDRRAFGEALIETVRRKVGRDGLELSLADAPEDVTGGVVVRDATGRRVWNNSLGGRLDRLWPALRNTIADENAMQEPGGTSGGTP